MNKKCVSFFLKLLLVLILGCSLKQKTKSLEIIGWREVLSIPALGIQEIKVKIDTGARTSSLHVTNLKVIEEGSQKFVEYIVHPRQSSSNPKIKNKSKVIEFRNIKSSNGANSNRPVIKVEVDFGKIKKEIEITLVNRDLMGFRMLLGRTALKSNFLVDSSKSFLLKKE
jgi:hypothetical protein